MNLRYIANFIRQLRGKPIIWIGTMSRKSTLEIGEIELGRKKRPMESLSNYRKEILSEMTKGILN